MTNTIKELNYTNVHEYPVEAIVPVIPWGSVEPHGEHLSYVTDTLLAEAVATEVVEKANTSEVFTHDKHFIVMPPFSMGSQNPGQTDKTLCIHFNVETQKMVLTDIVNSLVSQGISLMVIMNGHNGNNFKSIVRDLECKNPNFKIYVYNYLDEVQLYSDYHPNCRSKYNIDDHAGFTETSLMLYCYPEFVEMKNVKDDSSYDYQYSGNNCLWTPRNWDECSFETRVGRVDGASSEVGEEMFKSACEMIADKLNIKFNKILTSE